MRHWIATNILKLKTMTPTQKTIQEEKKLLTAIHIIRRHYEEHANKSPSRPGMFLTPKRYKELIETLLRI